MKYDLLSATAKSDAIARALISRQKEHFNYQVNIDNYASMLNQEPLVSLPEDWPSHIAGFKGLVSTELAKRLAGEDYELACRLALRDDLRMRLRTEFAQQTITESVYNALQVQLPDGAERQEAIQRIQAAELTGGI